MFTSKTLISLSALMAAGAGVPVVMHSAQTAAAMKATDVLLEQLRPGIFLEQYVAQIVGELRQADRQSDGLDIQDIKLARDLREAQMRASVVSEVLRQDLDGDLVVTQAEIERATMRQHGRFSQPADSQLTRLDTDGDGKITITEAVAARRERRPSDRVDTLLALDPNGDGNVTARELRSLAEKTFASVDSDGDDKISDEEFRRIAPQVHAAQTARMAPVCSLPELPKNARLVVFGTYEGDAISSAVIGGQDEETNLIDVTIEPGSQPLYLVLSSYESMVWRLNGATGRVAKVIVTSLQATGTGVSASGVMGLPASKVTIGEPNCPRYFSKTGNESASAAATIRRTLGRDPDSLFATYSAQRILLPSGQIIKAEGGSVPPPRGFEPEMWRDALRYWEAGLIEVDHRKIVTKARAEPYKVYPSQIGLAQLLGSGAIQRQSNGGFRIVRPIPHMPPSMGGAHSVKLTVAKGVPLPPGDPVHSCITMEDTGQSSGPACR